MNEDIRPKKAKRVRSPFWGNTTIANRMMAIASSFMAVTSVATVIIGLWVIIQNSRTIDAANEALKTAKDTFQLSLVPTLDIEYPNAAKPTTFIFQNTSSVTIKDVEVYPICYAITTSEPRLIANRSQSPAIQSPAASKRLASGEMFAISASEVMGRCPIVQPTDKTSNRFYSLVLVFKREVDNKRFVSVEAFGGGFGDNGVPIAISARAGSQSASGGPPAGLVESLKEIDDTENVLFRAS